MLLISIVGIGHFVDSFQHQVDLTQRNPANVVAEVFVVDDVGRQYGSFVPAIVVHKICFRGIALVTDAGTGMNTIGGIHPRERRIITGW